MHQVLSRKIICCLTLIVVLLSCTSCKATKPYQVKDYLNELALKSGISSGDNIDETVENLINWEIIKASEVSILEDNLKYDFLIYTINNLLDDNTDIRNNGWLKENYKNDELVDENCAKSIIDQAVRIINNREFESSFSYKTINDYKELDNYSYANGILFANELFNIDDIIYLKNDDVFVKVKNIIGNKYYVNKLSFEEVYKEIEMKDTFEIDFDNVEDIPGGEVEEDDLMYVNNSRELLASNTKSKVFSTNGFRVSYSFKKNGIDARISKKINGVNTFFDISLSNIKPTYKWKYKDEEVKESYLKVSYNSVAELGCSVGKYNNFYLDLKDKDASSFLNSIKSIIKTKDDEVETTIKICEIKTPIPEIPTAYFNIDIYARIYTSGKVEIVFTNNKTIGFETKNGSIRFIDDGNKDSDFIIGGSSKATLGVNFNIESVEKRLMDIETDAGIRAAVSTTLHLYDENSNETTIEVDYPYSSIDELSKENESVKVCGDVSLNWVLDIKFNTSKTLLYKFGLSKTKSVLDDDNQIFNNMSHIENGVFVKKCTRKNKFNNTSVTSYSNNINKIVLSKYSAVVNINETYSIPIRQIPSGYSINDLKYISADEEIVEVNNSGVVYGKKMGACEVKVKTPDNKYSASINILVSSGK